MVSSFNVANPRNSAAVLGSRMRSAVLFLVFVSVLLAASFSGATTYTVKAAGGGNYTTISACAAAASAGDSCVVYAGTYSGWTQGKSGSAGNLITFIANTGDTVNINSTIDLSSRSYVRISGMTVNSSSNAIQGNGTTSHNQIDHNTLTSSGTGFQITDGQGSNGSDNVIAYNTISCNNNGNCTGLYLFGDRNRIEYNTFTGTDGDCMDLGGNNVVVRFNTCKNVDGAVSGQHIDFVQVQPFTPIMTNSLIEGNTEQNCTNDGGNCHGLILRSYSPIAAVAGVIFRYNYDQNLNGGGVTIGGGSTDQVQDTAVYNNTFATENLGTDNGMAVGCWSGGAPSYAIIGNNIIYNSQASGHYPVGCSGSSDHAFVVGGDLAYNSSGGTFSWYDETGLTVNPLFANYPTDGTLQSGSPARGAGVPVATAVGAGTNSTSLTLTHAHAFQPGWAGVPGDYICIGSTLAQITALSYNSDSTRSGTATLASPVSWTSGAGITLAKKTDGNSVATCGAKPDIGAFPYTTGGGNSNTAPPAPINVGANAQ